MRDPSILTLATDQDTPPAANASEIAVWTNFNMRFPLSDTALSQLADSEITNVRYTMFGETVTTEVGKRYRKKYRKAFECVAMHTL